MLCLALNELLQCSPPPRAWPLKVPQTSAHSWSCSSRLCLFLNLALSFLLALPLGCLSCSLQDLCPESTSGTPGLILPSPVAAPRCCPRELHPFSRYVTPPSPRIPLGFPPPSSGQSCLRFLPSQPGEKKQFLPFSQGSVLTQPCFPAPVWNMDVHVHSSSSPLPEYKSSLRFFRNAGFE